MDILKWKKIFIQLYSLKDELAKDFAGTLERVTEIGYAGVEFANDLYGGCWCGGSKENAG